MTTQKSDLSLSDRMKEYEGIDTRLNPDEPVIIRVDGVNFSSYTSNLHTFDDDFAEAMLVATLKTCEHVGAIALAYTQSDEASFIMSGYMNSKSQVYLGGRVVKLSSILSSIFTSHFNEWARHNANLGDKLAAFDGRAFNVPSEVEARNYVVHRQFDARRNSVSMFGRQFFSHKELMGKSTDEVREMCYEHYGHRWQDLKAHFRDGTSVFRKRYNKKLDNGEVVERTKWIMHHIDFVKNSGYAHNILNRWG